MDLNDDTSGFVRLSKVLSSSLRGQVATLQFEIVDSGPGSLAEADRVWLDNIAFGLAQPLVAESQETRKPQGQTVVSGNSVATLKATHGQLAQLTEAAGFQ